MRPRRLRLCTLAFPLLLTVVSPASARSGNEQRARLDAMARKTLDSLFEKNPEARELFAAAEGYAVFSNIKISLLITGGGGHGVAVERGSKHRTYMHMGTAGLNLGLGGQKYQVVFFFETRDALRSFVETGWQAEASANAAAGTKGRNVAAGFRNGIAVYQLTEKGLMAQADISGTKYWKSKSLN